MELSLTVWTREKAVEELAFSNVMWRKDPRGGAYIARGLDAISNPLIDFLKNKPLIRYLFTPIYDYNGRQIASMINEGFDCMLGTQDAIHPNDCDQLEEGILPYRPNVDIFTVGEHLFCSDKFRKRLETLSVPGIRFEEIGVNKKASSLVFRFCFSGSADFLSDCSFTADAEGVGSAFWSGIWTGPANLANRTVICSSKREDRPAMPPPVGISNDIARNLLRMFPNLPLDPIFLLKTDVVKLPRFVGHA